MTNRPTNAGTFKKGHKKVGGFGKGDKHTDAAKEKVRQSLTGKRGPLARNWQAWYSVGEFAQNAERLEIIGNIYENPELLSV